MVGVFHRIGTPEPGNFTNSIEQILAFPGLITFDGVYTSVFDNRLALKDKKAILFVSGDQIGREGFCNKEQLLELERLGHILAWHGWSHRKLTELSENDIRSELSRPDWVKPFYAYPHGDFDKRSIDILKKLGYRQAYSTTQGENGNEFAIYRHYI